MIGESGVGKKDFISRFVGDDSSKESVLYKIGIDFEIKTINYKKKVIKLQIWDTAGQERFRAITKTYYKGSQGIIFMYDVTDKNSLINLRNWIKQFEANADPSIRKVLVGNKCDMPDRVITIEEGKKMAEEYNMGFFETSVKTNQNINEVFYYLVNEILIIIEEMKEKEGTKLTKGDTRNHKAGCHK